MPTKKIKASILAVSLIILGIMLVVTLAVSIASVRDRKASIGSGKSNQAFQTADTGIEIVMNAIVSNRSSAIKNLPGFSSSVCNVNASGHAVLTGTGYTVELKKENEGSSTDCDTLASDIANIKSVGTGAGNQRSIEAVIGNGVATINDTFDVNIDGWVDGSGSGNSISWNPSGYLNLNNPNVVTSAVASKSFSGRAGTQYTVSFDVIDRGAQAIYFDIYSATASLSDHNVSSTGLKTYTFTPDTNAITIRFANGWGGTAIIDNVRLYR